MRTVGFAVSIVLGAVGLWLVVTGAKSTQRLELGVLIGLWGLLLGAICARRLVLAENDAATANPQADVAAPAPAPAQQLEVRPDAPLEREQDAAARRAFAAELQQLLRSEIDSAVRTAVGPAVHNAVRPAVDDAVGSAVSSAVGTALAREVSRLRSDIAELRQELLDKVGGQLRLERIETTRLIGSDLEAMRAELDRLKSLSAAVPAVDERPAPQVVDVPAVAEPAPQPSQPPAPEVRQPPAPEPVRADDPFASLPRLTPFTDFDPEPAAPADADTRYSGRRRRDEMRARPAPDEPDDDASHAVEDEPEAHPAAGRRHRRDDTAGEDLLARLLAREGARR